MYEETLTQIHPLATERLNLYRLAARQRLTADQTARLDAITGQLPTLWDRYRREFVAARPVPRRQEHTYAFSRAA